MSYLLEDFIDVKIPNDCKLCIFDLDDTLKFKYTGTYSRDAKAILQYMKYNNIQMAVASLNIYAKKILLNDETLFFFKDIQNRTFDNEKDFDKIKMFTRICKKLKISYENAILFDDNFIHCIEASCVNMNYIEVDGNKGITWKDIKKGMNKFVIRRKSI
jgi:FMN phosphatase YigB (HAD superfamily)|uniref:FCP1 homology domain-containing protein n=1 Tax=viral metagenome TaxID=1070528 RepID=A0A6C0DVU5_9ZZZZ